MRRPAVLAVLALVLLSGCAALSPATSPEDPTLGSVGVRNHDDRAHDVSVLIERNGSIAHWETVHVEGATNRSLGSALVASGTYVDRPGEYVVKASLNGTTDGKSLDLTELAGVECVVVQVVIDEDGTYHFATAQNAYECEA